MGFLRAESNGKGSCFSEAYFKIGEVKIDWHRKTANFTVIIFESKAARDGNKPSFGMRSFRINADKFDDVLGTAKLDLLGKNYLTELYAYAKEEIKGNIVDA